MSWGYCSCTCPAVRKRKVGSLGALHASGYVRLALSGVRERGARNFPKQKYRGRLLFFPACTPTPTLQK